MPNDLRKHLPDRIWGVNCPACGQRNSLNREDVGIMLNCGTCNEPFKFDKPLKDLQAKLNKNNTDLPEAEHHRVKIQDNEKVGSREQENDLREVAASAQLAEIEKERRKQAARIGAAEKEFNQWRASRYPYAAIYERYIRGLAILCFLLAIVVFFAGIVVGILGGKNRSDSDAIELVTYAPGIAFSGFLLLVSRDVLRSFLDTACALCKQTVSED